MLSPWLGGSALASASAAFAAWLGWLCPSWGAPTAPHRHQPCSPSCQSPALCLPGTAAWAEAQPPAPLPWSRDLLQGWAAQPGPAGNLHGLHRLCSAVRAQPEFPAALMEICPRESQRIAPKLLEVVQDMAAFHTHSV